MYRREALIDERRKDVEWIDKLIEDSKTVAFKPEILREIETITAVSAALGLKFDPAAAVSYQRSSETGELRQQIDTMKLQLQLDQLKRDAELVRTKFESQTEPLNADLGKLPADGSSTAASSGISAADQLKAAIDRLAAATYDFNKAAKGAAVAASAISPLDDFRDRQAYRDMLKAARNAASLDELHDLQGAALLRLNFQATAIPDADKSSVPGVIEMRVIPPDTGPAVRNRVYRGWLDYVNRRANTKVNGKWQPNDALLQGAVRENFQTVYYLYAPPGAPAGLTNCHGFVTTADLGKYPGCSNLVFVAPQMSNSVLGGRAYVPFTDALDLMTHDLDPVETARDQAYRQLIVSAGRNLVKDCKYIDAPASEPGPDGKPPEAFRLQQALDRARARVFVGDYYMALERIARDTLKEDNIDPGEDPALDQVRDRTARAWLLTETFLTTVMGGCGDEGRKSFGQRDPEMYLTPWARETLWNDQPRVAIYEIGPREQVQEMSTVARSANSLSLALSIAASAPGSGAAADAAGSYSRQAMGRAETLERLPTVVGYSVGSLRTFGWVLGPRATIDPKGKIDLEQGLRSYDLTVDLSVPGWWPEFELETRTVWAPNRAELIAGQIGTGTSEDSKKSKADSRIQSRRIRVPMLPSDADYASFTWLLASAGFDEPRKAEFQFDDAFRLQRVSACRTSTIVLKGPLLWRATTVIVGGVKLGGSTITILPDMSGIMVDVPPLDDKVVGAGATTRVNILTPYGVSGNDIPYDAAPADGCKKEEKKPDPNAPSIEKYEPKAFQLPGVVSITAGGKQLDKVTRITFGGIKGTITAQSAESINVEFPQDKTSVLPPSMAVIVSFYYLDADKKEQKVDVTASITLNNGGK